MEFDTETKIVDTICELIGYFIIENISDKTLLSEMNLDDIEMTEFYETVGKKLGIHIPDEDQKDCYCW